MSSSSPWLGFVMYHDITRQRGFVKCIIPSSCYRRGSRGLCEFDPHDRAVGVQREAGLYVTLGGCLACASPAVDPPRAHADGGRAFQLEADRRDLRAQLLVHLRGELTERL